MGTDEISDMTVERVKYMSLVKVKEKRRVGAKASLFFLVLLSPLSLYANSLMYQSNYERTGVYDGYGPESEPVLAWKFDAGAPVVGAILVYDDAVYFSDFEGGVYALNKSDGTLLWEKDLGGQPSLQVTLNEDVVLVGRRFSRDDDESYLIALDRMTGEERWKFEPDDYSGIDAPTIYEGKVFLTSMLEHIFALDLLTGEELWRREIQGGSRQLLISENVLYFQDDSQSVLAMEPETGELKWSRTLSDGKENSFSTPAIDECFIYATLIEHDAASLIKLNKVSGEVEKSFGMEFPTMSSVSVYEGSVFWGDYASGDGGSGYMNAMDAGTGEFLWRVKTEGPINSSAAIAGDTVYFGSHDHYLYAVDRHGGDVKWRYETEAGIASSPSVVDGRVYFGSIDGHVYVLE
ncbi:PQQ-binding-like beta-propeller repeat protein [Halomonas sp. ML-15]|uniref:outer membrane protein assembly factor BamB family protein n=1 Tax=Halomonas sp. ML-15 TaxID=2773305 RepID=UPI001745DE5B|nr:PQQ-binding-like beta-propeller repeat protein [Halomonas sp. ML-15]MBD3898595.1 PQQ-binding-like beta-propeller repeat protein [Halomonas sp. ML-15]